ncbi:MAG: T9SS type A sorting domain-containing protein [Fluviicola sp.]|nr:T9SS type A sorting domain-containing protein [Fluviicola sp.]
MNQQMEGFQGTNTIQLDVATLPEGIYFASIVLDGTTAATKRFVVAK